MPNRSLDDFAGGDDGAADEPTADADADGPDVADAPADSAADTPDVSTLATYRWTPEATPCPQCGESVQKRWLDGDEYVCLDCKDW
ncbi:MULTISPECIES: DUF7573 domain-containing protein [Haloferax]|uniref:DUF7573 domain-containing protein n=1 Tax=Haloferax massiliensis TaxID=1476858 RepID=A0A0D6JLY1_9EURY|nr:MULTISPECIES: zinc ribbon domain-containing protein [Haloferax]MDS0242984.1 zinc ribbon domain-containing protein [Haloferax sp. S2CR25]MDS0446105.1 zinc ribbon domain-containing protein [Haloferax sp. S2CR25-2]CQR48869.1 hypothetical protein BN996_00318 [Haloferax massiliensis]